MSQNTEFLIIPESRVQQLIDWPSTFQAVEGALVSIASSSPSNGTMQPPRSFTSLRDQSGQGHNILLTMPGYLAATAKSPASLACKLVTGFPNNKPPVPTINAHIALFNENDGQLLALVAGTTITSYRTAAASVVATKHIAFADTATAQTGRPILAIFGAGTQGEHHAQAMRAFFQFAEIRIYNRTHSRAVELVRKLNAQLGMDGTHGELYRAFEDAQSCAHGADIIVTATFTTQPILRADWLKENVFINAVGAGTSHHSELSEDIYRQAEIFVDHSPSAEVELKGLLDMGLTFAGEVGAVVNGTLRVSGGSSKGVGEPQQSRKRFRVFHSLGLAVEDCAMARMIYDKSQGNITI